MYERLARLRVDRLLGRFGDGCAILGIVCLCRVVREGRLFLRGTEPTLIGTLVHVSLGLLGRRALHVHFRLTI